MSDKTYIKRSKHDKDNPYFMMLRKTAQNRDLSFEARGMLAYLLSKPDDWRVELGDLRQNCGRDKARGILDELVDKGYAQRIEQQHDTETGRFTGGDYEIAELPIFLRSEDASPHTENPLTVLPYTENPLQHNTDIQKIEEQKKGSTDAPKGAIGSNSFSQETSSIKEKENAKAKPEPPPKVARKAPPHWEHYLALLATFGYTDATVTKSLKGGFLAAAAELKQIEFAIDKIPALHSFVHEKARAGKWNSWSVMALAKYAPEFLQKHTPEPERVDYLQINFTGVIHE